VIASIHWGGNWGYEVPAEHRTFARRLIDAGVDMIHGHSSHHPMGIEVYQGKPVLYGCGDFLTDYEGIEGYEKFRNELTLMYFATLDPASGKLLRLEMAPLRLRRFRLSRPSEADIRWLQRTLRRESAKLGAAVELAPDGRLALRF
jgi:poly-gamma-glutamate capsule biosynthesis protein CapA/YwtB (metallophosphatase superfamily)